MRKTVFLMSMLLILSTASVKAQVTIGSDQDPHEGAVLDLSQTAKLGLLLPRVSLENVNTWQIDGDEEKEAAIGMIVYNTNDNVVGGNGYGLYVWDGNVWTPVKSDSSFSNSIKVVSFDLTPSDISISIYVGGIRQFTIDNFIPEDATYKGVTWNIAGGKENVNLTVTSATACTIQGVSAGEATLQVSSIDQNVNKTITIKVIPITVKSFELDKSSLTLGSNGKTGTITAQNFIGSDDQPLNAATVKWSIEGSNDTGSTIFPATGNTTTVTSGSTVGSFTVRATADGISHDCTVTISDCSSVTDFEGNTYSAAKFGDAGCWMTQNLRSTKRSGNETL
ncbi:MAG: hypothetical protein LBG15_11815, partial [Dysgonamonadaceae bacterium]|nr:hypothetical protein [Dysgonamonadaceae bacterium]